MSHAVRRAALAALFAASGCLHGYSATVTATPIGVSGALPPREPGCTIDVFRLRAPDQAFDEVAILQLEAPALTGPQAVELLRRRACEVGADALVVTGDLATVAGASVMTATALAYREAGKARAEAARQREELARRREADAAREKAEREAREAQEPAERAAREAREAAERAAQAARERAEREANARAERESRDPAVHREPPGFFAVRAAKPAAVLSIPDAGGAVIAALEPSLGYWASRQETRGYRRVRLRDGRTGFVAAAELEAVSVEQLRAEQAAKAAAAGAPAAAAP